MKISMPKNVSYIIETIQAAGFEAYAVGGCVRDSILGREPDDWDITTSAKPEEVKALFRRTIDTGIAHGTVTIMIDKEGYEVTTYRIDGEYEDARHPKEVIFTPNLIEDLKRRDFTINAMAYNETAGLIDIFEGMQDMKRKVIRCVGDPMERFGEDALRMLRGVRFCAQLGYAMDDMTKQAIVQLAANLSKISAERIQVELVKLVTSRHPECLYMAYETGITAVVLPEFDRCMTTKQNNPHHSYSVGEHILRSMMVVPRDKVLRLTMLLHDIGKAQTRTVDAQGVDHFYGHVPKSEELTVQILRRLKFDNDTIHKVSVLVRYHDLDVQLSKTSVRKAIHQVGEELFPLLFEVKRADIAAQSDYQKAEKEARLEQFEKLYQEIVSAGECVSLKTLAVTGSDLIQAGMKPGKEIGELLKQLLTLVMEDPSKNTKEYLLQKADELMKTR